MHVAGAGYKIMLRGELGGGVIVAVLLHNKAERREMGEAFGEL